jgi:MFS family permease
MKRLPVTVLCGAQFLAVLDATIVASALPDLRRSLGFSPESLQWVLSAYALAFGGLLVVAGRAGDLIGQRRLFVAGVAGFGAASLACALAPSPAILIAGRALQGLAAAVQTPAALALLTTAFPAPDARRRAVGWWTAAAAGGGASGWVLGGVLVESFGWPAVFLVNVPLCAIGALLGTRLAEPRRAPGGRLDLGGSLAITAALTLLVLGLTQVAAALAGAVVAFAVFALLERRAANPVLPRWALRRPVFRAAAVAALALTAATTPAMFLAILYQQETLGRGPLEAGLWCAPFNLAVIAGSLLGRRGGMTGGLLVVAAGAATLIAAAPAALLPAFLLMGGGLGVAAAASTASGTAALGEAEQGVASGVLNAAAQIGTALGLGVCVPLGQPAGFAAAAVIAVLAATRSFRPSRRRPTTPRRRRSTPAPSTGT